MVTNAEVVDIIPPSEDDEEGSPTVVLTNGESHRADVIIGADGHRSRVRRAIEDVPAPTPLHKVVYNARIPLAKMKSDTRLQEVMDIGITHWMGDGYEVIGESLPPPALEERRGRHTLSRYPAHSAVRSFISP